VTQRKRFVEFVRRHPAVLLDNAATREHHHAAKPRQRHFENAINNAIRPGGGDVGVSGGEPGTGTAADDESGGMYQI
jgi:hypothetical protein